MLKKPKKPFFTFKDEKFKGKIQEAGLAGDLPSLTRKGGHHTMDYLFWFTTVFAI